MSKKLLLLASSIMFALPMISAEAGSRYATPPAIVLSPDLAEPWTLQLKPKHTNRQRVQHRAQRQQQKIQRKQKRTGIFASRSQQRQTVYSTQRQKPVSRSGVIYGQPKQSRTVVRASASQAIAHEQAQRPIDPKFLPQTVHFDTSQPAGTILIDTNTRFLYLVQPNGKARRYGVGVGKLGFEWSGTERVTRKAEWPSWRPPSEMIVRERKKGRELPTFMEGGPENPLGARAIYLGSTLYRIHGTNQPWSIGQAVSSGCIRMRNEDVMDLYERVQKGAKVVVS